MDGLAGRDSFAFLGNECAGWGPAGIYVGEIESVELGPEDVAFCAEGGVGLVLLFAAVRVFYDPCQRKVAVFGSLRQAAGEVVKTVREPRIMLA